MQAEAGISFPFGLMIAGKAGASLSALLDDDADDKSPPIRGCDKRSTVFRSKDLQKYWTIPGSRDSA